MIKHELNNKTFIITGATKGLGEVIAKEFSTLNMNLVLIGRDKAELKRVKKECSKESNIKTLCIDLLNVKDITKKISAIADNYNEIHGIIHVAGGGYGFREPLLDYTKFLTLINLNLLSVVQINNIIIPKMLKNKKGNIIHIGSIAAIEAVASVGYNTSKTALSAYVKSIGQEFAKDNLIISGINPGGFITPNNAMARLKNTNKTAYNEFINNRLPRKKMGKAEELLDIIKLLSSSNAGMFCGCMIKADASEGKSY